MTLAKELITLDNVSGGRLTLGIGAGGVGFDATAMGQEAWTVPNLVVVPVGADGNVNLLNAGWAPTHVIADVFGYYS